MASGYAEIGGSQYVVRDVTEVCKHGREPLNCEWSDCPEKEASRGGGA